MRQWNESHSSAAQLVLVSHDLAVAVVLYNTTMLHWNDMSIRQELRAYITFAVVWHSVACVAPVNAIRAHQKAGPPACVCT